MSGTNGSGPKRAGLGERLNGLREQRELTWRQVREQLERRGIHATEGGLSGIATGRYKSPRPALLDALCEILGADIADFPEWWRARALLALGVGETKLVRYDSEFPDDALEDVLRARRLGELAGPASAARAARKLPSGGGARRKRAPRKPPRTA